MVIVLPSISPANPLTVIVELSDRVYVGMLPEFYSV